MGDDHFPATAGKSQSPTSRIGKDDFPRFDPYTQC